MNHESCICICISVVYCVLVHGVCAFLVLAMYFLMFLGYSGGILMITWLRRLRHVMVTFTFVSEILSFLLFLDTMSVPANVDGL
jgi:hypothetical protein